MRVAIASASPATTEAVRRVLLEAGHTVAWVARSDVEALQLRRADAPEALVLELARGRGGPIDAVDCARALMAGAPCPLVVVAEGVDELFERVYRLMEVGAVGAVEAPRLGPGDRVDGGRPLVEKLRTVARLAGTAWTRRTSASGAALDARPAPERPEAVPPLVAIGASAGGPQAIADALAGLPRPFPGAVVIVQHVDSTFAEGLASWLQSHTAFPTKLAQAGARPMADLALVAATADHLVVEPGQRLAYTPVPRALAYRPSVDVFFRSAAEHWPIPSVGVLLTGMGRDGADGLLALREAGWSTIAQDEATSAVYGMPRAAVEVGAVQHLLPLSRIGSAISEAVAGAEARRDAARATGPASPKSPASSGLDRHGE